MESNVYTKSSISRSCHDLSFSQGLFTRILSTRPSIMRPRLMSFGGGTSLKCLLQLYFSAACVCILSVFCSHFGVSNHGAALNHLSNGPTGSDSCASEIKIFCASSPAIVSPLGYRNKKKRGVLTFPEVPECVKGNSKRVTE